MGSTAEIELSHRATVRQSTTTKQFGAFVERLRPCAELDTMQGNKYDYYFYYNMQTLWMGTHIIAITYI